MLLRHGELCWIVHKENSTLSTSSSKEICSFSTLTSDGLLVKMTVEVEYFDLLKEERDTQFCRTIRPFRIVAASLSAVWMRTTVHKLWRFFREAEQTSAQPGGVFLYSRE